jgi:hypothetical protein
VRLGLTELQREGNLSLVSVPGDDRFCVTLPSDARRRRRKLWRARKPLAKLAYAIQLTKTAFTFGDSMVPYALWKVERHSGTRFEPTERQRRHPLIFGWPIVFRILRERALR